MTTIKDVARRAGVSTSTVSRALSGKIPVDQATKERVLQAVMDLNYHPNALAKGLKEGKTGTLGLVIPNIRNPIFPAVARGVEDAARRQGYTVVLCNTDEDVAREREYVDKLRKMWVDGILFATTGKDSHHIQALKESGFPVVLLIRHLEEDMDTVIIDNEHAAYEAVSYLVKTGHKRIAMIYGDPEMPLYRRRYDGYIRALKDAGLPALEELIVVDSTEKSNGYEAMSRLLHGQELPDAVFAMSDPKAMGVIRAIKDRGYRVPEDISVIGFDDLEISEILEPPLSTVSQPLYEMGVAAADRLIQRILGDTQTPVGAIWMNTRLVIRKSTRDRNEIEDKGVDERC